MNVFICFCPGADPAMPHAALPALGAQLREDGICNYFLRDLNLEAFIYFLTKEKIAAARESVASRVKNKEFRSSLLLQKAQQLVESTGWLPGCIELSVAAYRDIEAFYNLDRFLSMKEDINAACQLISFQYNHIQFNKYSLFEEFPYNNFEEIRAALDDPDSIMLAEFYRDTIIPEIKAKQPEIVGISVVYFSQLIPAFLLAVEIRKVSPNTHIIQGGPIISWGKDILIRQADGFSRLIDSFCVGEGEPCIKGLVKTIKQGGNLDSIPNLVYFKERNACVNHIQNQDVRLEMLPTPDYQNMPMAQYLAPERVISLPLTKGCYYNRCKFCNYSFIKMTKYRERPVRLAIKDIEKIVEQTGEKVFSFESDVIRPEYLLRFSRALLDAGLNIKWHSVMRFEKNLDREFFDTLASAGCIRMYLGLESANPRVLKEMNKGTTINVIREVLKYCNEAGIATEIGVFVGYPGETAAEAEDSLNFIIQNRDSIDRADTGPFRLLKGSPVANEVNPACLPPGKTPDDYWYTMEYRSPEQDVHREKYQRIIDEIESLYPNLKLMDISQEILYLARYGKQVLKKLNKN
jgi:radical SAM superfamily enzyme YgiQ (UPF0313 family)